MNDTMEKVANVSPNASTDLYRRNNEYVMSLPRMVTVGSTITSHPDSVFWLILKKLNSLRAMRNYFIEILNGWKWLLMTKKLKGRGRAVKAIVIGNGPSQGFLNESGLCKFKASGGEVICVNLWTENEILRSVVPTYMVVSDVRMFSTSVPEFLKNRHDRLVDFMHKHTSIGLICPLNRCDELADIFGVNRIVGFVDTELRMWSSNISPLYPRGYLSMTLYKALALAIWFDYKNIYLIGMDNTYPRDIYCDVNNSFIMLETHANSTDIANDQSALFGSIADGMNECAKIFFDVLKFQNKKILNLDPYSLTDAFRKTTCSVDVLSDILNTIDTSGRSVE